VFKRGAGLYKNIERISGQSLHEDFSLELFFLVTRVNQALCHTGDIRGQCPQQIYFVFRLKSLQDRQNSSLRYLKFLKKTVFRKECVYEKLFALTYL